MEDTRKIQIAENKFPMLIMGDENRFLKISWENRASRYQMTPQSFSFFLHVAMYSASHGFNAVYNGIQQRYAERKQI
ncbi:hypothetical protein RhiirB3_408181, partial [Rhizophagus irregularis]